VPDILPHVVPLPGLAELTERARGMIDSGDPISRRLRSLRGVSAAMTDVDTGPLVAVFDRAQRHSWVAERFKEFDAPMPVYVVRPHRNPRW